MPEKQDHSAASLAPILTREDGAINFSLSAKEIYDRWRGFQPWPGAWTIDRWQEAAGFADDFQRMWRLRLCLLSPMSNMVVCYASCGEGSWIAIQEVQLEGKRRMPAEDFLRGFPLKSGDRFGA